ncbi:cytidylate kinase [Ruminococcus sp. YE71]|uniref:(d)CMP kinase n=1 Tax=unclassified Ruminococcus TaxID=2608920 RepID=UPI00088FA3A4|nr:MULTISPECIES: (d)CMP kinase [unclassified Ruminococcus]SDA27827.1 cytidylate kinase [Ruminococcus sp. YE78]SFW46294.1 cytidylate kinase [Ruminococcus sp. YE71]
MAINIALDGPSGAGKSTIARRAAEKLGYVYVDTGAMYRSIAYHALQNGADLGDAEQITAQLDGLKIELTYIDGAQAVLVNGENVSDKIRTPEVSMGASKVSAVPAVREFLLDTQRNIAKTNDIIMDGRDIGTVVLPDAQVKLFLTASAEERANRRFRELQEKGDPSTYEEVLADINQRDYNDTHREIAPLRQAEDAQLIDSTSMTIDEVVDAIVRAAETASSAEKKNSDEGTERKSRRDRMLMPLRPISKTHKIGAVRQCLYNLLRPVILLIFKARYKLSFEGLENIPRDGGNIFASNHRGYADPVLIALHTRVPISYMAKKELFEGNKAFKWLITFFGAFPVDRGSGDTGVIDTSIDRLESGRNLVIFPEGTRSKDGKVGKGKTGVALIAAIAQTKVVPVGINFEGEKMTRGKKVVVRFGEPIDTKELGITDTSSPNLKKIKKEIMDSITKLVY